MLTTYLDTKRNVNLVTYFDTDRRVESALITYLDTKRNVNLVTYFDTNREISDKSPISVSVNTDTCRLTSRNIVVEADMMRVSYAFCGAVSDTKRSTYKIFSVNADTKRPLIGNETIPININIDTKRILQANVILNSDTKKNSYSNVTFRADAVKVMYDNINFATDAERCMCADIVVNADTIRLKSTLISVSVNVDTGRKLCSNFSCKADVTRVLALTVVLDPNFKKADIGIKSLSIQTGVQSLSDRFTVESVGKPFSGIENFKGEVAGFKFEFQKATRGKTTNNLGHTTYTAQGRPDMGDLLYREVSMMKAAARYNGAYIISCTAKQLCWELGIDANITDFHPLGIGTLDEKTLIFTIKEKTVKAFLDKLFGWSNDFADRQMYYFNRNGKITVREVGKYTTVYNLDDDTKYRVENITSNEQKIRKFVDYNYSTDKPKPPKTPGKDSVVPFVCNIGYSGTKSFGDAKLSYESGYLMLEETSESSTKYTYESTLHFAFASNKNVLKEKVTLSKDGTNKTTTTYEYDVVASSVYASADVDVSLASERTIVEIKNNGAWEIDTDHKTTHVPMGNGFFGQRVEEVDKERRTTVATSMSRGSTGGLASMYMVQLTNGYTVTHPDPDLPDIPDFDGELITGYSIPVADADVLGGLIRKINWMNGKIEEIINLSIVIIPGASLVDAVGGVIIYQGNLYYPQSTNAVINERGTRQQISAIRWYEE